MSDQLVDAIRDLTRVVIATSGNFESRADAIRKLHSLNIAPSRIAAIFDMASKDVTSVIAKGKKRNTE